MKQPSHLSEKLLQSAFEQDASDIHFYPQKEATTIYFRIHGKRSFYQQIKNPHYNLLLTYFKFTAGMDIGEVRRPQSGTIFHEHSGTSYSLRLSTLPVNQAESLAIRILSQQASLSLDQLFLFPHQYKQIEQWMLHRAGLILLSGPTGSGKTTTLYSLLQAIIQKHAFQTITLEDPIEKTIQDILQVQVNEKAGITYQTGLKAALRHDPDIIMVGEIRDAQTAKFALEAALTGHLVLSTVHAKHTIGTIHRLKEMGFTTIELEQSLIGIASLQLLPVIIGNHSSRRAAIMELLDGTHLELALKDTSLNKQQLSHSFQNLKRKAYAYGFISKHTLQTL